MRRAVTPVIPPKAYRHFAVVTLALTAALAMFADGENREARALDVAQPESAEREPPARFATSPSTEEASRIPSGWNDEFVNGAQFGQPMAIHLGIGNSSVVPEEATETVAPEDVPALNKAERERLLRGVRESIRPVPSARD